MSDRVFLAIGIYDTHGLPKLKGAIPSAKALYNWALTQDYDADIVTDENGKVTADRVRDSLEALLGQGGHDRVLISFAGHGLTRNGTEDLWLLSDWRNAPGAIDHAKLRQRIEGYLPAQVGIISDACRSFVNDEFKHVEGTALIRQSEYKEKSIQRAILNGTLAGSSSYSTPSNDEAQYCFLSKIAYDALRGALPWEDTAKLENDVFYHLIENEVPKLARKFNVKQVPDPQGSFRANPDNVWSFKGPKTDGLKPLDFDSPSDFDSSSDIDGATPKGGVNYGLNRIGRIENYREIGPDGLPLYPDYEHAYSSENSDSDDSYSSLEYEIHEERFKLVEGFNRDRFESASEFDVTINGASILEEFIEFSDVQKMENRDIKFSELASPSYLARLETGEWCGAALFPNFNSNFLVNETGVAALRMSKSGDYASDSLRNIAMASMGMSFGNAYDIAGRIRSAKHVDPVLGAIAAYSYYQIGEINEIRRMAYFYSVNYQALPFDIAMLAQLELVDTPLGLSGVIPAIKERSPKTEIEEEMHYTYAETQEASVLIGGQFPWLTRGWDLVGENRNVYIRELNLIAQHVKRSCLFTTLSAEGGERLINLIKRQRI